MVAGLGSEYRGDDAVGRLVASMVAARWAGAESLGLVEDPLDLLGAWDGADLVVVIDALSGSAEPGTVNVLELDPAGASSNGAPAHASTHGIGLVGAWQLARAISRAPRRVVVVGVEGASFELGAPISDAVWRAVPELVERAGALIEEASSCA